MAFLLLTFLNILIMKANLIAIISVIFLTCCERLDDSFILNGQMLLNNEKIILSRGSFQFSNVIKILPDGSKQNKYSFYRLNVSPSTNDNNKSTFILTAFDKTNNQKTIFFKDDIEVKLIRSFENQSPNFLIYDKIIDAELKINKISKRNIVEGFFSFKVKSTKTDTLTIKNGSFTAKLEIFETSEY